jgi:hypothetical protein
MQGERKKNKNKKQRLCHPWSSRLIGKGQTNILLDLNQPGLLMGIRDQKARRWHKEEGKISALNVGRLDSLRENGQNGKESVGNGSLNDLWWRIGDQGLFYLEGSHSEPLINLEMGPQCEVVTFLIDSGAPRSSIFCPEVYSIPCRGY